MEKTNVSRLLDAAKIDYSLFEYDTTAVDGMKVSELLCEPPDQVFKTLVTQANTKEYFVFCVPVNCNLDLKKAAVSVGVKSISMIHQKELLPLTGYIHGGCSPIGMKKQFKTVINETAMLFDKIFVSAGRVGKQICINPIELKDYINGEFHDIIV